MEGNWKVKLVMRNGTVLNGLYGTKDEDSPQSVIEQLLGVDLPGCEKMYGVVQNEDGTGYLSYLLSDVLAVEIV